MTENYNNSNLTKKYFFKLDESANIDPYKSFPEPIYSPLVVVNAKNMLNFDSKCKEKSNELNKKIEESSKKIIKEFTDNNPENGVIIKEKNVYQIIITTNETEYFETSKEVENIVLDIINIFSILCDKRIDIDSISLGAEDGKIASMVFNRQIFNDKKQIGNNAIQFQAFIDNFENIFKNYFELKKDSKFEVLIFFNGINKTYLSKYIGGIYTRVYESFDKIFFNKNKKEQDILEKIKNLFSNLLKCEDYKNLENLKEIFNNKLLEIINKDVASIIIDNFTKFKLKSLVKDFF